MTPLQGGSSEKGEYGGRRSLSQPVDFDQVVYLGGSSVRRIFSSLFILRKCRQRFVCVIYQLKISFF